MLKNDCLFEDFLKKIKETVTKMQNYILNQKDNFKPNDFLLRNCSLYKRFFQESMNLTPDQVFSFFVKHIKNSIHSLAGNLIYPSIDQVHHNIVILGLFRSIFDGYTGENDVLKEKQHLQLIDIGQEILKSDYLDKNIKKNFLLLINSSSHKSPSQVVTFIFELDKYIQQQTPIKSIEYLFKMISSSISDMEALEVMISNIQTIKDMNPQYYTNIIEVIQESFHQIITDNPESYAKLFSEHKNNQNIVYLDSIIGSWGSFEEIISIKTVLCMLQLNQLDISKINQSDLYQTFLKLKNAQEPLLSKILGAINIIFETYLYTDTKQQLSPFVNEINNIVLDYYQNYHSNLCKNSIDFFSTVYPTCLLFLSPFSFEQIFLPILQKDDDFVKKFNSILLTVAPIIDQNKIAFYDVYAQIHKTINDLIQKNDKELNLIVQSIRHNLHFFRYFIYEDSFAFQKLVGNGLSITYFDLFYNEFYYSMPIEPQFWSITKYITSTIIKTFEKKLSNYSSPEKGISQEYIKLSVNILNFMQYLFQNQNVDFIEDDLITILYNCEAITYTLLSINKKTIVSSCKNLLGCLYTIIQKLKLKIGISKKKIYTLGTVCKNDRNVGKEFAMLYKNYSIKANKPSKGRDLAISILYPRFEMLIRVLFNKQIQQNQPENQNFENSLNENQDQSPNQQLQESQEQQIQNPNESAKTKKIYENLKSCIYILFPLLRESSTNFEEFIYLILENNDQIGNECTLIIANSLSSSIYYNIFQFINNNFKLLSKKSSNEGNKIQTGFVENSFILMKILLNNHIWLPNTNYSSIFTSIVNNSISLCAQLNMPNIDNLFCHFIISLFEFTERVDFEIKIDSKVRNDTGKAIVSWINRIAAPEKENVSFELYYLALLSILDGIDFHECKSDSKTNAYENFLFYYSQRRISETLITTTIVNNEKKTSLLLNNGNKVLNCLYFSSQNETTLSILNPIFKNNIDLCINHTISQALDPKTKVRTAFMNALSSALTPETYQKFVNPVINRTVADLIFENDLEILKLLAKESPYKSGEIAEAIVKASALKRIEMKVFEELAKIEIMNNKDPTRNTLFRGNGITSRAISYFPKYFAEKWANDLIHPLLSLDKSNLKVFWNALIPRIEEMFLVMPSRMKEAIRILFSLLSPESKEIAFSMLSGFVFLRFLCPMLAKVDGLVDASSLLMSASIRPTIGENRPQFMPLKNEVSDAHFRIQKLFQNIVSKPSPIEIKPLNPPPDSESITSDLIAALWTQMSFLQKTFHQTPDDRPIRATLDLLIAKLKEAGNPHRKTETINISEGLNFESLLSPPLIELLQTNKMTDSSLEKWFFLCPTASRDGSFIFMMNMSEIKQPFTAQQLCAFAFSQVLSIGDAKYSVFVEFADFDVELLPSLSQIKKTAKLATNEMLARLATVYICRVQESALSYLNKATKLLKKLPLKNVTDMKMIRDEIGELKLDEATMEFLSPPEATFPLQEKSNYPVIRLHQKSIQIIDKAEINQVEFFTSNVFLLSSIENIGQSQVSKTTSSFTIRTKSGKSYNIQSPASFSLRRAVFELFHNHNEESKEKLLYVDRSSFSSLLLILSFLNMLNDSGDQELKASALNLYNTTIESSGLKTSIEKKYFSKDEIPFTMLQLVEVLARDLAISNPNEVHSFFLEFVKVISFFDYKDYANSERFLQPWIHHAADQIITNPTTLNCLAQIATNVPKKCFMQLNKSIWQNFTRIDLLEQIFTKICNFEESCFASVFLSIAVKYSTDVTKFLVNKFFDLATDLTQRQFRLAAEILNSMIVGELFDSSFKTDILHKIAIIRLLGSLSLSKSCFMILQALINNNNVDADTFSCSQSLLNFIHDDIENVIADNIENNEEPKMLSSNMTVISQRGDYRQFICDTAKLSILYREYYSETFLNLFIKDTEGILKTNSSSLDDYDAQYDLIPKLNGIIFISALKNDYKLAFEVYKLFYNFNPYKTLAICSTSLSLSIDSIPNDILPSLFFTSIASLLYTDQTTPFDLINSIFKDNKLKFDEIFHKVQPKNLLLFDKITNLSFSTRPLFSFLLVILNFYGRGKIDLPNTICQSAFNENSQDGLYVSLFRYQFDASLEKEISSKIINNSNENIKADISAVILILYLWHPFDHMKRLLLKILEAHPQYFSNIDFSSIYNKNSNQFKFLDTELVILLTKATFTLSSSEQKASENKYQYHPIISSTLAGDHIASMTLDQTKSIFHAFLSS